MILQIEYTIETTYCKPFFVGKGNLFMQSH